MTIPPLSEEERRELLRVLHLCGRSDLVDAINRHEDAVENLAKLDREAGFYVETVIAMRTHFTGDEPYVGWKGLGLALNEALDERDRLRANQRTPVTVEVCKTCRVTVESGRCGKDHTWSNSTDAGPYPYCPIRQPKAQTTSAERGTASKTSPGL